MLSYFDLKKGTIFILDGQPYEVLDFKQMGKAQNALVAQTKVKNLITGKIVEKNFHQGNVFKEANLEKMEIKFLYANRGKFWFCQADNPANRFQLEESKLGDIAKFLKTNQIVIGIMFQEKFINIEMPIKINLKVIEAPPGVRGDRSSTGTKLITLETGAKINTPLFIKEGDIIEINTQTGEYVRRI